jgi:hypothetical protein
MKSETKNNPQCSWARRRKGRGETADEKKHGAYAKETDKGKQ